MKTMSKIIQVASVVAMLFASSLGYAGGPGAYAPPGSPGVGGPGAGGAGAGGPGAYAPPGRSDAGGPGAGGNGGGDGPAETPTYEIDTDVAPRPDITPTDSAYDVTTSVCTDDGSNTTCKVDLNPAVMDGINATFTFSFTTPGTPGDDPLRTLDDYVSELDYLIGKIDAERGVDGVAWAAKLAQQVESRGSGALGGGDATWLEGLRSTVNAIADHLGGKMARDPDLDGNKADELKTQLTGLRVRMSTYIDQLVEYLRVGP